MIKNAVLIFIFCLLIESASAQEEKIEADRPGETQTPGLTSKGYLQFETGIEKDQNNKEDHIEFHPLAHIKYGLSDRLELRAEIADETEKIHAPKDYNNGLKPIELGFKLKLIEEKGILPATSLYTQVGLPMLASDDFKVEHVFPKVRLLFENKIADNLKLVYNLGSEWNGEDTKPEWLYTIAPELEIGNKWEAFLELFGQIKKSELPQHNLDGGVAYYASNNVKLDIFGGVGISKEAPEYFISAGVSFRLRP